MNNVNDFAPFDYLDMGVRIEQIFIMNIKDDYSSDNYKEIVKICNGLFRKNLINYSIDVNKKLDLEKYDELFEIPCLFKEPYKFYKENLFEIGYNIILYMLVNDKNVGTDELNKYTIYNTIKFTIKSMGINSDDLMKILDDNHASNLKRIRTFSDILSKNITYKINYETKGDYEDKKNETIKTNNKNVKAIPETITVLFLAANPITTSRLGLDEEVRSIQEKIRLSKYRNSIRFESRWAVCASDILQAINETNPTIVHFSGHGAVSGKLVLQNPDGTEKLVSQEAITMTIATASDTIRLVVFNACFSQQQAESVVEHIEAAIGMSDSIPDDTACVFAAQLYSSIGFGLSLKTSFDQAKAELLLEGISGENIPCVFTRDGIDSDDIVLVSPKD